MNIYIFTHEQIVLLFPITLVFLHSKYKHVGLLSMSLGSLIYYVSKLLDKQCFRKICA